MSLIKLCAFGIPNSLLSSDPSNTRFHPLIMYYDCLSYKIEKFLTESEKQQLKNLFYALYFIYDDFDLYCPSHTAEEYSIAENNFKIIYGIV